MFHRLHCDLLTECYVLSRWDSCVACHWSTLAQWHRANSTVNVFIMKQEGKKGEGGRDTQPRFSCVCGVASCDARSQAMANRTTAAVWTVRTLATLGSCLTRLINPARRAVQVWQSLKSTLTPIPQLPTVQIKTCPIVFTKTCMFSLQNIQSDMLCNNCKASYLSQKYTVVAATNQFLKTGTQDIDYVGLALRPCT